MGKDTEGRDEKQKNRKEMETTKREYEGQKNKRNVESRKEKYCEITGMKGKRKGKKEENREEKKGICFRTERRGEEGKGMGWLEREGN